MTNAAVPSFTRSATSMFGWLREDFAVPNALVRLSLRHCVLLFNSDATNYVGYCLLPIAYRLLPMAYCLLPTCICLWPCHEPGPGTCPSPCTRPSRATSSGASAVPHGPSAVPPSSLRSLTACGPRPWGGAQARARPVAWAKANASWQQAIGDRQRDRQ